MPQAVTQFRENTTPKERAVKLNELARFMDKRLSVLEAEPTKLTLQSDIESLYDSITTLKTSILNISATIEPLALLINGTRAMIANLNLNGNLLIFDVDGDSYIGAAVDDLIVVNAATAAGEVDIDINGATDFTYTVNSFNVLAGSNIIMADDTSIGLSLATARITFDDTPAGDAIRFNDCTTVEIENVLGHIGDADTYMIFTPDFCGFRVGNVEMLYMDEGAQDEFEINPGGVDIDTIINTAFASPTVFVEGSTGNVGIGGAPANELDVQRNQNDFTICRIINTTAGALSAALLITESTGGNYVQLGAVEATFAVVRYADKGVLYSTGNSGFVLEQEGAFPLEVWVSGGQIASFYGNLATERQIRLVDGNVTRPAYSFLNDTNLGFYRIGVDTIGIAMANALDFQFSPNTFTGLAGSSIVIDTMTIATGSITDTTGAIDFGNENLTTTGVITGNSFITGGDIGIAADTDLLQLAANALTINGTIQTTAIGVGIAPAAPILGYFYRDDASTSAMVKIEQDGTGDASLAFQLTGITGFSIGIDNSNSDRFLITPTHVGVSGYSFVMGSDGHLGIGDNPLATYRMNCYYGLSNANGYGVEYLYLQHTTSVNGAYDLNAMNMLARNYGTANNTAGMRGILMQAVNYGTGGTVAYMEAAHFLYGIGGAGGTTTSAYGCYSQLEYNAGTLVNSYDYYAATPKYPNGTVTNQWCFYSAHDAPSRLINNLYIDSDTYGYYAGAGRDARWYYDGNDMIFDSQVVGTGDFIFQNGNVFINSIKSGATQVAAGAAANEIWKTSGHASLPDNVLMAGV